MENPKPTNSPTQADATPQPEVLKTRTDDVATGEAAASAQASDKKPIHRSYRPSHKATFIGLGAVVAILAINAVVFGFVLKKQAKDDNLSKNSVTISSADLNRLGINRGTIGTSGVQLVVAPDSQFKGAVTVGGKATISGDVVLNSKLTGTSANLTQLQAGETSLAKLNVNGDGTLSTLNLRKDLVVAGVTQLQGGVTVNSLLTVNNNLVVLGNLSIGGTFSAHSLTSASTLTIGGHVVTSGPTPGVSGGGALGSNGTVSISGNDAAGVVAINIGVGAAAGTLASVSFANTYSGTPRVVITSVGVGASFYILNVGTGGFSIAVASGLPPGGYRVNYIVMQ